MSSFRFLSLSLLGGSLLLLLLSAACEAKDYGLFTPQPDYDSDYNATFEYSFFTQRRKPHLMKGRRMCLGNTSMEDLERFEETFMGPGGETDEEEETGGQEDSQDATVTPATTRRTTVKSSINVHSAATLPFYPELRMLVWTLVILMVLKSQLL